MTTSSGGARIQRTPPSRSGNGHDHRLVRETERRVLWAIEAQGAIVAGERVLVGVSGGPDSTALLLVLAALAPQLRLALSVAHVDHGLRPAAERAADIAFVRDLAGDLSLGCVVEAVRPTSASEDSLRRARYRALRRAADATGATVVALGHTADDQAETLLLHLVRGAGLHGLAGMRPRASWPFAEGPALGRPLLGLRRAETEAYARARGWTPRPDLTNQDRRYARNRLRAEALPVLLAENPHAVEAIARAARSVDEALALVESEAGRVWPDVAEQRPDALMLRGAALSLLPDAVRHAVSRRAVLAVCGEPADVGSEALARIDDLLTGRSGRRADLGGGVEATCTAAGIVISHTPPAAAPLDETSLRVPGATRVGPWTVEVVAVEGAAPAGRDTLDLAANLARAGLTVRSRRPGDRIRLSGGTRKVQDVLVDAKVPRHERDGVPLVCDASGRVLWVVGHGRDPTALSTPGDRYRVRFRGPSAREGQAR